MDALHRPDRTRRPALVLLGPDDACTALLAEVLSLAGLPGASPADAVEISALTSAVLRRNDADWEDVFGPRPRRQGAAVAHTAQELEQARALVRRLPQGEAPPLLADPQIAGVGDLWTEALREEGFEPAFVLLVRDPQGVADELAARGAPSRARARLLWTRRMLAAEAVSRDARRVFVALAALAADPDAALDRIEHRLQLRLPQRSWSTAAILERRMSAVDGGAVRPPAEGLGRELAPVAAFWSHLAAAAEDAPENADTPAEVSAWFEDQARLLAPLLQGAAASERPAAVGPEAAAVSSGEVDALTARAVQAEARLDALARERDETPARLLEAQAVARSAAARVEVLESALAVARRRAVETEALLQDRARDADASARDARRALADAEAAAAVEAQRTLEAQQALAARHAEAWEAASQERLDAHAALQAGFARDRAAYAAEDVTLRAQLALGAVELDAARTHGRALHAKLDAIARSRARPGLRAWLARRLGDG